MPHTAPAQDSPSEAPKRPRGILKNSTSFQNAPSDPSSPPARPQPPNRELSEKELVQQNTSLNAVTTTARRQSSDTAAADEAPSQRLKWDEANLYLNEGQMGGKMKIDEPKTPYAGRYDPGEDEEEVKALDARELAVDELDMKQEGGSGRKRESEIPGLDLGEPEVEARDEGGERRVVVGGGEEEGEGRGKEYHGEEDLAGLSGEEREKHRQFEAMRKRHYEMKNVKNLLGHSEELDELEDDEGGK